jgi:enediyne biosynthesis protein E4
MSPYAKSFLIMPILLGGSVWVGCNNDSRGTKVVGRLDARDVGGPVQPDVGTRKPGFHAATDGAGIEFRMHYLPSEQGENFKINLYDHGAGLAVGDYDGDGDDDIYFCNQLGSNALYRNRGDGTFEEVTHVAGPLALEDRICVAATFTDYDNDGDQDLFVTSVRGGNVLLQNDGCGYFRDVTGESGVGLVAHSQSGVFFDCDEDGDSDLLVTNTAAWTTDDYDPGQGYYMGLARDIFRSPKEQNALYRNNGDGTFSDMTEDSGLAGRGWSGDAVVWDYDDDGHCDVVITNMFGPAQLYQCLGNGRFCNVTAQTLQRTPYGSVAGRVMDVNNDGRLDLYLVDMHSDMWLSGPAMSAEGIVETKKYRHIRGPLVEFSKEEAEQDRQLADELRLDYDALLFGNALYKNLGDGKLEEISDRAGAETFWPWGIAAGDFDNDGFIDAFIPSGMGYPFFHWRNCLLMNNGDETFSEESQIRGVEPRPGGPFLPERIAGKPATRSSRAAATADFDGDGRLDLIVNNFNEGPYYYRNEFPRRPFVSFRLFGTRSNRDAVGATVRLCFGDQETQTRQIESAAGYLSQSSRIVHFGLGPRDRIARAEIRWPSGAVQFLEGPAKNTMHAVTEPQAPPEGYNRLN